MEEAVRYQCREKKIYGILHHTGNGSLPSFVTLMVNGGPQMRIGPHRLYVQLARFLASQGVVSLRFDYEGIGDSEGDFLGFEHAGDSIKASIDFLSKRFSSKVNIILWSLCDGATASILFAARCHDQVMGLILCNPFILENEALARANLRYYYLRRLFEKEFWKKMVLLKLDFRESINSVVTQIRESRFFGSKNRQGSAPLGDRIVEGLEKCDIPVRIILSKGDIVATSFLDTIKSDRRLKKQFQNNRICVSIIKDADHTFIAPEAMKQMFQKTLDFLIDIQRARA